MDHPDYSVLVLWKNSLIYTGLKGIDHKIIYYMTSRLGVKG